MVLMNGNGAVHNRTACGRNMVAVVDPEAAVERYRAADHPDRKPNPGMILRAISEFGIDPAGSLLIGDQDRDIVAAQRAGVRGVLYQGGDLSEIIAREIV